MRPAGRIFYGDIMWFYKIKDDLTNTTNMLLYMETQYKQGQLDVKLKGKLERNSADLPGLVEYYFNLLQELESILEYIEIERNKKRSKHYRKYIEGYNRALSSSDAGKFADGEPEVIQYNHLINEVALMRNKYLGLIKGLEVKGFQINNIVKLRSVGIEDASI